MKGTICIGNKALDMFGGEENKKRAVWLKVLVEGRGSRDWQLKNPTTKRKTTSTPCNEPLSMRCYVCTESLSTSSRLTPCSSSRAFQKINKHISRGNGIAPSCITETILARARIFIPNFVYGNFRPRIAIITLLRKRPFSLQKFSNIL